MVKVVLYTYVSVNCTTIGIGSVTHCIVIRQFFVILLFLWLLTPLSSVDSALYQIMKISIIVDYSAQVVYNYYAFYVSRCGTVKVARKCLPFQLLVLTVCNPLKLGLYHWKAQCKVTFAVVVLKGHTVWRTQDQEEAKFLWPYHKNHIHGPVAPDTPFSQFGMLNQC